MGPPRVYGMSSSGNCYKVRLLLEQLQLPYQWVELDVRSGATRQPEFLQRNPNGRVPTLEYLPGRYLVESNAILAYLAEGSAFWPQHRLERAQALQWMFFEQYSHEPYIAVARYICVALPAQHVRRGELPRLQELGYQALAVMEQHLARTRYFVGDCSVWNSGEVRVCASMSPNLNSVRSPIPDLPQRHHRQAIPTGHFSDLSADYEDRALKT